MDLATQQRGNRRTEPHRHADMRHHAGTVRAFKQVIDQRAPDHHAGCSACTLQDPARNQDGQARSCGGQQRAHQGDGQAHQQNRLAAQPVGHRTVEQLQSAVGDNVSAEGELDFGLSCAKQRRPLLHGGQADRHGNQAIGQLRKQDGNQDSASRGRVHALLSPCGQASVLHGSCPACSRPPQ